MDRPVRPDGVARDPGQFETDAFRDAVARILAAAHATGKRVGMVCASVEECRLRLEQGMSIVGYSFDTWLLEGALRDGLSALRA